MLLSRTLKDLGALEDARLRILNASAQKLLRSSDIDHTYEALFLRCHVVFETYIEQLFYAILSEKILYPKSEVSLKANIANKRETVSIISSNQKYLDWLPYSKTLDRADRWLIGGRPFKTLESGDRQFLDVATWTRNHIAHRSSHTKKLFLSKVICNASLPPNKRNPAGWLRSKTRHGHDDDRLQAYMLRYGQCAQSLYPKKLAQKELKS